MTADRWLSCPCRHRANHPETCWCGCELRLYVGPADTAGRVMTGDVIDKAGLHSRLLALDQLERMAAS
jgi:hypothetical protein